MNIFVVSLVWGTFCHEMDVKKFSQRPICDTMMAVRTKSVPGEEKSGIKECVMTVKECYDMFGGDYEEVLSRLLSEARIEKYMRRFLDDTSFALLCTSLQEDNRDEAFRAAHTLKGLCQNLGFGRLYESAGRLTELLRDREKHDVSELLKNTEEDYILTISAIRMLQG